MNFDDRIDELQTRINTLARFVHVCSLNLDQPVMYRALRGFRFANPDWHHFCLLRACRIVSALNATLQLARSGYPQEIGVLLRVIQEASSQIKVVNLQIETAGKLSGELATFVADFFSDTIRIEGQKPLSRRNLGQKYVNELIGAELDSFNEMRPDEPGWKSTADRFWYLDWVFSNYIHGRYPETMDLYGGYQGHFHLHGMRGTPKDAENVEFLDETVHSVSLCFVRLAQTLKMDEQLRNHPGLREWRQSLGLF